MLPTAGTRGYTVYQMDGVTGFLGSKLDEESDVHLRLGVLGCPRIAQLNHSLYAHKQSPRCWLSAKHILPHVLHTYLPVSSRNTIPPYPPCAFYISFLLLKLRWPSVTTLGIGSYSGLDSSPYGIPCSNHIENGLVYLVYYWET